MIGQLAIETHFANMRISDLVVQLAVAALLVTIIGLDGPCWFSLSLPALL